MLKTRLKPQNAKTFRNIYRENFFFNADFLRLKKEKKRKEDATVLLKAGMTLVISSVGISSVQIFLR